MKDININIEELKMTETPLINFDINKYIKFFCSQEIIDILRYILLENKLVFFSSYIENLTSFLTIFFPFKYQYQIISILHKEKFHYLNNK